MATILLVDDERAILELLEIIVMDCGHRVLTAPNGVVALSLARQHKPSLVLTDLMMPFMDGYGLVAALRADPLLQTTPVVVITAGGIADERHLMPGLIQGVIAKPFLVEQIEALCATVEAEK